MKSLRGFSVLAVLLFAVSGVAQTTATVTSTSMTSDGRLLVAGQPYFFIGLAPGPSVDIRTPEGGDGWRELAEGGVNVVRGLPAMNDASAEVLRQNKSYMDNAAAHGMYVWPFLSQLVNVDNETKRAQLKTVVETFKDHPAVFFWKFSDEPEWAKVPVPALAKAYQLVRQLDPNHLVWISHAPRGTTESLRRYNAACDVIATDIYPVSVPAGKHSLLSNKGLSMVGDYTRRMVEVSQGQKMVFMILQVFWSGANPAHNPVNRMVFPSAREERYMVYQAIINGANSLSFFGLTGGLLGRDKELGLNWTYWRAVLKPLLAEFKQGSELYPVLIAPETTYPLTFSGAPQIEVRAKEMGVYLYIMAAAREGVTQQVRFSGLADGEVSVLFENRTLEAKDGAFSDSFAQHDVHVYRAFKVLPKELAGDPEKAARRAAIPEDGPPK